MQCPVALLFVYWLVALTETLKVNYCGARMCGNTNTHTFCHYSRGASSRCNGYMDARLSAIEKTRILNRLNQRRHEAASGKLRGLPTAGNMLRLRWVDELAREAQIWANQCRSPKTPEEHDRCRDLYSITVGQCVASVVGEAPGLRVESMVDMWYMQSMLYKGNVTVYVPPHSHRYYGDFGQIMWSRTYMVGCGRSRFMTTSVSGLRSVERLVCNFAPKGPTYYRPLWTISGPASDCPPRSRRDKVHTSLCDYQYELSEYNDVDNTMTLEEHLLLNSILEIEKNESLSQHGALDEMYMNSIALAQQLHEGDNTLPFNSVQKRDVEEFDKHKTIITDPVINNIVIKPVVTVKPKKKISTIGRPKSYKVEDLSITEEPKEDNIEVHLKKNDNEIYGDYNVDWNVLEDNITEDLITAISSTDEITETTTDVATTTEMTLTDTTEQLTTIIEIHGASSVPYEVISDTVKEIVEQNTDSYSAESMVVVVNEPIESNDTDSKIEDYLSDPETVKELQAALDRMETESSKTPGLAKVRRDINNFPRLLQTATTASDNSTVDTNPMISMVLKYMPYLQQYEKEITGTSSSGQSLYFSPSVLLFIVPIGTL